MNLELLGFVQLTGVAVLDVLIVQAAALGVAMGVASWLTRGDAWRNYGGQESGGGGE
jgi:hypothetical protein